MDTKVIIVGGAKVGTYLAQLLLKQKHEIRVIEPQPDDLERLKHELPTGTVLGGSGTDPLLLESAGIRQADVLVAVTGSDEVNLVATSLARFEFNVPRTIARINNPKNAWMFTPAMGVDVALNQADLIAHLVAEEMSMGDMVTLLKLRKGQFSLVEEKVAAESPLVGKTLRDLTLPRQCVLLTVIRKGEVIVPHGDLVFQIADEVLALVHASQISEFDQLLHGAK